jgi:4-amino-4-deoxy-L-arabinose transferase-like glycosyltransferase
VSIPAHAADRANPDDDLTRRQFAWGLAGIVAGAAALRMIFPTADPPWNPGVGVVWHDEGAWVHNARNMALFGAWRQDAWNPMFLNPVFTVLEYLSFAAFGVGLRQARLVSQIAGTAAVTLLGLGVARVGGRRAGLIAASLLATSYVTVMYDRAAVMESTMVALLVAAWWAYARSAARPIAGAIAALAALAAFLTKASAIFMLAALGIEAVLSLARSRQGSDCRTVERAAWWTLGGLLAGSIAAYVVFVGPNWREYLFYNYEMSVTRKPSYALRALADRASWLPIVHDFFTRLWMVAILAAGALTAIIVRWRTRPPAERLLVLWIALGTLELILHDVGNERRLVLLIPPMAALAAITTARDRRLLSPDVAAIPRRKALWAFPLVLFTLYVLCGAVARLVSLYEVRPGVRLAAAVALALTVLVYVTWPRLPRRLSADRWSVRAAVVLGAILASGGLAQYGQWVPDRTYRNYDASVAVGRLLPPGTLVHGKLANGLSLENRIRPIFIGQGFGNYADRFAREDVRYLLTYIAPREGYEGPVIREVLQAYPHRRLLAVLDVAESPGGRDQAALFEKGPLARGLTPRTHAAPGERSR